MYETPEFFELGDAAELTLGRPSGAESDGLPHRWIFFSAADEEPVAEDTIDR